MAAICRRQPSFEFLLLDRSQRLGRLGGGQAVPKLLNEQNTFGAGKAGNVDVSGHKLMVSHVEAVVMYL